MEREALKMALKVLEDLPGFRADIDNAITAIKEALAQPAQEPKSVTYKEVADTMNALRKGNFSQKAAAEEVGKLKLYTAPPQPALEQNFCPRCGKRTKDIHTCTPP